MAQQSVAASVPTFGINLNGRDVPPAVRGEVTRVTVDQQIGAASAFEIELNNWSLDRHEVSLADDPAFDPGARVLIEMGYLDDVATLIDGEVTGLEITFPERARALFIIRGQDRLHRLRRGRRTRVFENVRDSDVVVQIARDLGLTTDVVPSPESHAHLLQANQTDLDFLQTRARSIGYELTIDGKTLSFRPASEARGASATLSFLRGLMTFEARLSTADQVSAVTVRSADPLERRTIVARAAENDLRGIPRDRAGGPSVVSAAFGERELQISDLPVASQQEADLLARATLEDLASCYVTAEAVAVGDPTLRAGETVEIDGVGTRFGGPYLIDRAVHTFGAGSGYTTSLQLRRSFS
ncbi:MAG: contractile injection system protein, VgrG/Pvc8 family [Chloroflexota bacterium]